MRDTFRRLRTRLAMTITSLALTGTVLSGCATTEPGADDAGTAASNTRAASASTSEGVFDSSVVHEIDVELDEGAVDALLATYEETGDKEWVAATVTIDGTTFEEVGMRLKGNSSLRSAGSGSEAADLPWLVDLDKYVDGRDLDGFDEFVVRSNTSETALNEAVTLDLLSEAGLASEEAIAVSFSVGDGEPRLRLVVQNLDGDWEDANFETDGALYKAESTGDYSYRGEDPADYEDVFDQETNQDEQDLEPLIGFLEFINEASDAEFAAGLADHLDVESFATYLAFEDLVDNQDDIDGPGNNSYLRYDATTGLMTVVAWDHNLAFGAMGQGGPGGGFDGGPGAGSPGGPGGPPEGLEPPSGADPGPGVAPDRPGDLGGRGGDHILVERFTADESFNALYEQAAEDLRAGLVDSGTAQGVLDAWTTVLSEQAADLVDPETIEDEASTIEDALTGDQPTDDDQGLGAQAPGGDDV